MPAFFFDIYDGYEVVRDEEGQDWPSLAAAHQEAEESARELAGIVIARRAPIDDREIRVRDPSGVTVATVRLMDVLNG